MKPFLVRNGLLLIVLAYFTAAISYALATPPLEASDEYKHYPVVQYVQTEGRLPVLEVDDPGRWLQEGAQPPLYYLLMAGVTSWIDTRDLPQVYRLNRHAFVGNPNQVGNKNLLIHQPDLESFPWEGSVLAIYVIRLASIVLGAGTIIVVARLGTLLFDRRTGHLAAALTAFTPMFLFVHAAVNNDSLAILLGHAGLYLLLRLWRERPDPREQWRRYTFLGLLLGLGLLTKLSLAGLLLLSGLALAWLSWKQGDRGYLLIGGAAVLLPALALAAPWLVRNWRLYGDPTAMNVFIAVQGTRDEALALAGWIEEFGTFYRSFWGLFGGVNIAAPAFFYTVYNVIALAGAIGFTRWFWRRRRSPGSLPSGWWLAVAWSLLLFFLLLRWNVISPAFQGRLIFPGLGAIYITGAKGLLQWVPAGRRRLALVLMPLLAFGAAALLPWITIRPAYARPQPLAEIPEDARFGPIRFHAPDGAIDLVGVQLPAEQSVTPGGGPVEVTLYWQVAAAVSRDYLSSLHLLGRELESVGSVNRHPASGMIPTSEWEAGQIWRDVYHLYASRTAEAPARLQIRVGLYDPAADADLPATGPAGDPLPLLTVGAARLAPPSDNAAPAPDVRPNVPLADGITLLGYSLTPQPAHPGSALRLTLYWRVRAMPSRNYQVFVHLLDTAGEQIVVADGPPVAGYFPTAFWRAGDVVEDEHTLAIPADLAPGDYRIAVGLYDPDSGARLTREDGQGDTVFLSVEVAGQ
ncbi:MAG: glycosyltransferase family 39 protein [Candidatus Promineifilaceae bacterium]|nr:glycosyltransferase family 39 protein [Candidatus Promineifilaceae bacterium]